MSVMIMLRGCFFLMIRRPPGSTRTDTSFPTRRSSDLGSALAGLTAASYDGLAGLGTEQVHIVVPAGLRRPRRIGLVYHLRSEEHTSELQSLMRISYAVFCLQKKNEHSINTQ